MGRRLLLYLTILAAVVVLIIVFMPTRDASSPVGFDGVAFSPLDSLGRAGSALAMLSPETLGSERGDISSYTPTGYQSVTYDSIEGGHLYNRCHLVGAQLAPRTEVQENLITGTRRLNVDLMLPIENEIVGYISRTGEHVLYRVTPDFRDDELVCRGVTVAAWSIESAGLRFSTYLPNEQPGIDIDYATGFSGVEGEPVLRAMPSADISYVLNTKSKRFHMPECSSVPTIKQQNRQDFTGDRQTLIDAGYRPCGSCNP